ncbi:hypothetical protein TF3313_2683 [Tannerella forsythia 3313]|nr:hypothetical protein TF3313_1260 [Tannerella forsythia 3313]BAR50109.1 hypothetical protein TF3313_2683 [Tannerella forsythia 3313]
MLSLCTSRPATVRVLFIIIFLIFFLQDSKIVAKNTQRRGQKTERRPCVFICPV